MTDDHSTASAINLLTTTLNRLETQLDEQRKLTYEHMLRSDTRINELNQIVTTMDADRKQMQQAVTELRKLANEGRGSLRALIFVGSLISGLIAVLIALREYIP